MEDLQSQDVLRINPSIYWNDDRDIVKAVDLSTDILPIRLHDTAREIWTLLEEEITYADLLQELRDSWEPFGDAEVEEVRVFLLELLKSGYVQKL